MTRKLLAALGLLVLVTACSGGAPTMPTGVKVGKPYNVQGQTYYPQYDPHYDQTGVASWYGPGFHGNKTANGERFDKNDMTAAHPTLPMPSMVRVTNLENGRSTVVRINDRGPFARGRIIDLSHKAADTLGVVGTGTAKVRVQYLKDETEQYWAQNNLQTKQIAFAKNDPYAPDGDDPPPYAPPVTVAQDADNPPMIRSSAPVMTVSSNDLRPEDLKIRPLQPRFKIIDDAQADEGPDVELSDLSRVMPVRRTNDNYRPQGDKAAGEAVTLYNNGKALNETASQKLKKPDTLPSMEVAARPTDTAPSPTRRGWFVQVGSFASEANASKMVQSLGDLGSVSVKDIRTQGGSTLHRVRVGPFADRNAADFALGEIQSRGTPEAKLVENE